jgi:thioredoxin
MIKKYLFILLFGSLTVAGCSNNGDTNGKALSADEPEITNVKSASDTDGKTIHITKADFLNRVMDYESNPEEWVYKGDRPCLIDFYADWCGPCKIASPVLDELAKKYKDDIYIFKVDTEVERELASVFGIRSIPAFLFCPEEGKPTMSNGIARTPEETKQMFIQMIDEILLGKETVESL